MKYIRTSDGAIYEMINDNTITFCSKEIKINLTDSNHRIADSIDKLCDAFVVEFEDGSHLVYSEFNLALDKAKRSDKKFVIYGAIWTQLGLFYQAKMNEKEDMELI